MVFEVNKFKYGIIFSFLNSWRSKFDLWSEVRGHLVTSMRSKWKNNVIFGFLGPKNLYFNIHHSKSVNSKYRPLIRCQRSFGDLYKVKMKKKCHFCIPWPKKPIFQYTSCKVSELKILASDQRSEVIWWFLRGQNEKVMSFLDSLAQETYISIYNMQNEWI